MDEYADILGSGPVILKHPGAGTLFVRTEDNDWVPSDDKLLRVELARHQPHVPLFKASKRGKVPVTVGELVERHGQRVDKIYWDLTTEHSRFIPSTDGGGQLYIACGRRPYVQPEYSHEVDRWLRELAGDKYDKLLDWLATCLDLSRPSAGLYLAGPPGAGKGLLYAGVARMFGRAVTSYDDIVSSGWTSALRDCPVVLLDEGCKPPKEGSAAFRSLVAERQRPLTEKYRPSQTLLGCVRLIIGANNVDALRLREELTEEDEAAIGERILYIRIPALTARRSAAGAYLESIGGSTHTAGWVSHLDSGEPGALPRHIAWLVEHRTVKPGRRFLVEGEAGEWLRNAGMRGGLPQQALVAIARIASGAADRWEDQDRPVWFRSGEALVNVDRLHRGWRALSDDNKTPTLTALGHALNVLATGTSRLAARGAAGRPRVKHIPAERVVDIADMLGIGDPDRIRSAFGLPPDASEDEVEVDAGRGSPEVDAGAYA